MSPISEITTETQVSAGGVAYPKRGRIIEIVLISVGEPARGQLPKGLIDQAETNAETALREVREEAGIETEVIDFINVLRRITKPVYL